MTLQRLSKPAAIVVLANALMLLPSCGNNGCEETRESYFSATLTATGRISLTKLYAWALTANGDSLMTSASSPTSLELMLRPDTTETRIRLQCTIDDSGDEYQYDDTLTIGYQPNPYFLDMECGCSMFYDITEVSVTDHLFKGITINNSEITNEETVNITLTY